PRGIEAAHAEALLLASPRAQPLTRDLPELGQDMLVLGPLVERILIGKVERDFEAGVVELARGAPYVPHGRALETEFLGSEKRILADVERAPAAARVGFEPLGPRLKEREVPVGFAAVRLEGGEKGFDLLGRADGIADGEQGLRFVAV